MVSFPSMSSYSPRNTTNWFPFTFLEIRIHPMTLMTAVLPSMPLGFRFKLFNHTLNLLQFIEQSFTTFECFSKIPTFHLFIQIAFESSFSNVGYLVSFNYICFSFPFGVLIWIRMQLVCLIWHKLFVLLV